MTAEQFQAWKRMARAVPLRERIDAFLDYFLDQRDGLLLYAPFYAFEFLGLVFFLDHASSVNQKH